LGNQHVAETFIGQNTKDVINSQAFLRLSKPRLQAFLEMDKLTVDEEELLSAVVLWCNAECERSGLEKTPENRKTLLKDVKHLIRFGCLTSTAVVKYVKPSGLLTDNELLELFTYLSTNDKKVKHKFPFSNTKRQGTSLFRESALLTPDIAKVLAQYVEQSDSAKKGLVWRRIYHGKTDGMIASSFHRRCDAASPTLTVIRSRNGNIFGGYTVALWNGSGYKNDPTAWIFSLINQRNAPFRLPCTMARHAIATGHNSGPTFGGGYNIYLANDFTSNSNYSHPHEAYHGHHDHNLHQNVLAGAYNFMVDNIEVFTIDKK